MASTDYGTRDQTQSTMEQMGESAREASRQVASLTDDIAEVIKERPYTALAVAAGLAFAAGALWKLGPQRRQGALDSLLRSLPEAASRGSSIRDSIRDNVLPSGWR